MKTLDGIDDIRDAVGTHLGYSDWYDLGQPEVNAFADATHDHQWIHVDVERARAGAFGTTIAHGYFVLSLLPMLCWQVFRTTGLSMEVNYGLNKVRFPAPALVPARVRAGVELVSLEPAGDAQLLTLRAIVEREGGDKPLCVAETLSYLVTQ